MTAPEGAAREFGEPSVIPQLSTYIVPGRVRDPERALIEAQTAERAGFGKVWIAERYDLKDIGVLTGAVAARTSRIGIASGLIAIGSRHPILVASWAATAQAVFGPRITVGLGRGIRPALAPNGFAQASHAATEDYIGILRALWRGEVISYDGPAGTFPNMKLLDISDVPPARIVLGGFAGPRLVELAARCADGIHLAAFLSLDVIAETVRSFREAAERAGRDPAALRISQELVSAPGLDERTTVELVHARAITYLQMGDSGERLAARNGWRLEDLERLRADPLFANLRTGVASQEFHRAQLVEVARKIPKHWIEPNAGVGSISEVVDKIENILAVGVDEVCLHGASPSQTAPLLDEWRARSSTAAKGSS